MSEAYGLSLGYTAVLDLVKSISALTSMPTDEGGISCDYYYFLPNLHFRI